MAGVGAAGRTGSSHPCGEERHGDNHHCSKKARTKTTQEYPSKHFVWCKAISIRRGLLKKNTPTTAVVDAILALGCCLPLLIDIGLDFFCGRWRITLRPLPSLTHSCTILFLVYVVHFFVGREGGGCTQYSGQAACK